MTKFELFKNGVSVDDGYFKDLKAALMGLKDSNHKGEHTIKWSNKEIKGILLNA